MEIEWLIDLIFYAMEEMMTKPRHVSLANKTFPELQLEIRPKVSNKEGLLPEYRYIIRKRCHIIEISQGMVITAGRVLAYSEHYSKEEAKLVNRV